MIEYRMKPAVLLLLVTAAAVIAFLEFGPLTGERGMLLPTITFWCAVIQGCIAAAAVCDLINARWIGSLRRELLSLWPLLLLPAILFPLLWPLLHIYPWTGRETAWLNPAFFMGRNTLLLFGVFAAAAPFVYRSLARSENRKTFSVIFLFLFVASQTLVGFDWVMSLEYPWISTLFGAYFFVESLYAGFAAAGVIFFLLYRRKAAADPERTGSHLRDLGVLLFGFSVLWGGLFYAQLLLLWYGNLPEEVGFIIRRISASPYREMSVFFIAANFLVPFLVLLSERAKHTPWMIFAVSALILLGILTERLLYILPVVKGNYGILVLENLVLLAAFVLICRSRDRILPASPGQTEEAN